MSARILVVSFSLERAEDFAKSISRDGSLAIPCRSTSSALVAMREHPIDILVIERQYPDVEVPHVVGRIVSEMPWVDVIVFDADDEDAVA